MDRAAFCGTVPTAQICQVRLEGDGWAPCCMQPRGWRSLRPAGSSGSHSLSWWRRRSSVSPLSRAFPRVGCSIRARSHQRPQEILADKFDQGNLTVVISVTSQAGVDSPAAS